LQLALASGSNCACQPGNMAHQVALDDPYDPCGGEAAGQAGEAGAKEEAKDDVNDEAKDDEAKDEAKDGATDEEERIYTHSPEGLIFHGTPLVPWTPAAVAQGRRAAQEHWFSRMAPQPKKCPRTKLTPEQKEVLEDRSTTLKERLRRRTTFLQRGEASSSDARERIGWAGVWSCHWCRKGECWDHQGVPRHKGNRGHKDAQRAHLDGQLDSYWKR